MSDKTFTDHAVGFLNWIMSTAEDLEKALGQEKQGEASQGNHMHEVRLKPTFGYAPRIGDQVKINFLNRLEEGFVSRVNEPDRTVRVAVGDVENVRNQVDKPWSEVEFVSRSDDEEDEGDAEQDHDDRYQEMTSYYEERLARAQEDARAVSAQHQNFMRDLCYALNDSSLSTEKEIVTRVRDSTLKLTALMKRLNAGSGSAIVNAIEALESLQRLAKANE